jgi:hypothetical protein
MGSYENITIEKMPKQGELGRFVRVIFHGNTSLMIGGNVVRDDLEDPFLTVIHLNDGRYVLGTECQYQPYHRIEPGEEDQELARRAAEGGFRYGIVFDELPTIFIADASEARAIVAKHGPGQLVPIDLLYAVPL